MYFKDFRDSYFCSLTALDVRCRYCGFLFMRKIAQLSAVHILTTCWPRLLLQWLTANENKHHSHSGMQCFASNLTSSAHIFYFFFVSYVCIRYITRCHFHAAAHHRKQIKHSLFFCAHRLQYFFLAHPFVAPASQTTIRSSQSLCRHRFIFSHSNLNLGSTCGRDLCTLGFFFILAVCPELSVG